MLAAIPSPFAADGELDIDAFAAHLEWLLERGLDGVFVAGTTGEGVLLEADEVVALVARAVAVAGSERVIAQVGRPSTRATAALLERAHAAGAGQVAAYVPWFYPATDEQVRAHFLALARAFDAGDDEAADRASAALTPERDAVAREGPTIAAIKQRVRAALGERGVDYPASLRAPFS